MHRFFLILALIFISCTYSFNPSLYSHIKSIAIPVFGNETVKYGLAETLTEKFIQAFMEDGRLRISGENEADSVLDGKIFKYENLPFIYDEYEKASSFKITIGIEVQFQDRVKDRIIFSRKFEDWGYYPADGEEEEGIERAVEKLKDKVIRKIIEGW